MKSLEDKWRALHADSVRPVFQLVDAAHPLDLYIGRDPSGVPLLLLVLEERPPTPRQLRNIGIEVHAREDGQWGLLVRLLAEDLENVFTLLCADLVEATRSAHKEQAGSAVIQQLSRWQALLERSRSGLLSPQEVRGLFGELAVLKSLAMRRYSPVQAVSAWQGPSGGHQDFSFPNSRWEVKTVRVGAGTVRISSELQLEHGSTPLVLIVIELQESLEPMAGAATLNSLVSELRALLGEASEGREVFERTLAQAGYLKRPEYDLPYFLSSSHRLFDVRDEFPRLTPSKIPVGVSGVQYELTLSTCARFVIEEEKWER